jgi:uncharacterized protein with HEPN domain
MSHHDSLVRVRHMLDYSLEAIELLGAKSVDELQADRTLQLALVQLIQIVGEASKRVGDDFCRAHPSLPWAKAAKMRDKLIHGYDVIDFSIVHRTVTVELPALVVQLRELLGP